MPLSNIERCLALALPLLAALATPAWAEERRTVTWYADHPQERASVQLVCLDDPGHLAGNPDCVNAHEASVEVALREARLRTGAMDPSKPAFWSRDPNNRRNKLLTCRLDPQLLFCDVARRSLLIEAGKAK